MISVVVLDFFPSVLESFYREYGERVKFDGAPWGQDATAFYKHPLLLESGYSSWWGWLRDRDWLWSTFPAVPGAIGGIKRLRAAGHYVECVTSKPDWAEYNVWKWLGKWRPAFNRVTIVTNGQRKMDFTSASIIVDDKRKTCLEFVDAERKAVLFDRSNKQGTGVLGLYLANNWEDVINCIEQERDLLCGF